MINKEMLGDLALLQIFFLMRMHNVCNEQYVYVITLCIGTYRRVNNVTQDQMLQKASNQGLHCLPLVQQCLNIS